MKKAKKPTRVDVLFLRDLPKDLKDQFKAWCSRRGRTMKDVVCEFMKKCAKEDYDVEPIDRG